MELLFFAGVLVTGLIFDAIWDHFRDDDDDSTASGDETLTGTPGPDLLQGFGATT